MFESMAAAIDFQAFFDELDRRKFDAFRLAPHQEMEDHGDRRRRETAEKKWERNKRHQNGGKRGVIPAYAGI